MSNAFAALSVQDTPGEDVEESSKSKKKRDKKKAKRQAAREEKAARFFETSIEAVSLLQSGFLGNLDETQTAALASFRELMMSSVQSISGTDAAPASRIQSELAALDDADYLRYLRAREWNITKAGDMLTATLKWRAEIQPQSIELQDVRPTFDNGTNLFCSTRVDKKGRPVLWTATCNHDPSHGIVTFRNSLWCQEELCRRLKEGEFPDAQGQWCQVFDLSGYGLKNSDVKWCYNFIPALQSHYPERLGVCLLVNAPAVFSLLWKAVRPWLDARTREKVVFVGGDYKSKLRLYINEQHLPKECGGSSSYDVRDWIEQQCGPAPKVATQKKGWFSWMKRGSSSSADDAAVQAAVQEAGENGGTAAVSGGAAVPQDEPYEGESDDE